MSKSPRNPKIRAWGGTMAASAAGVVLLFTGSIIAQVAQRPVKIVHTRADMNATFVTGVNRAAIPVNPAPGQVRVEPMEFLRQYGRLFGVDDPQAQLVSVVSQTDNIGHRHTTFQQVHNGVRVFSGALKVHQDRAGAVVAANGDFYPLSPKLNVVPALNADGAEGRARADLARTEPPGVNPAVERSELVIVDPGWYGDPPAGARLAYYIILSDAVIPMREAFFVDAQTGEILDRWSLLCSAQNREVYDGNGTANLPGTLVRDENDPPSGIAEADAAFDYTADYYGFLTRAYGRDSIDDLGLTLRATVRSTFGGCPNARWNGAQTIYCVGAVTDDVVGHEFTHGLTDYTGNMIYQNQPGQLNESYSDVLGELIDLFNGDAAFAGPPGGTPWPTPPPSGSGTDTPNTRGNACGDGIRWRVAEDASAFGGAIRDMWNPPCNGDPDRGNASQQTCSAGDNGGVHSGSGIPNHAFAMLTDGKTFNGYTVTGIGPIKSGAIWYRALAVYLTEASDFEDAYFSILQAAADLVGTTPNDPRDGSPSASAITLADVDEVEKALLATEMNTPGRCGFGDQVLLTPPPASCTGKTTIYAIDFESGATGWTVSNSSPPTPYDWSLTSPLSALPFARSGVAWFCDDPNIGDCAGQDESAVHTLQSPAILLPAGADLPLLAFTHYIRSEGGLDGGNVKIQVNSGGWQLIPRTAFLYNAYNARLNTVAQGNTSPLAGEAGWSGVGGQWGTSVVDLASFAGAGDTIEVRFELGKDGCDGVTGWFVDDIEVYECPDCEGNGQADIQETRIRVASLPLGNIGAGSPQSFTIVSPPTAGSVVTFAFTAVGDFSSATEFLDVEVNGTPVGTVFTAGASDCPATPDRGQLLVPAATFNAAVGGGNAVIDLIPTADINATLCSGESYVTVEVSYGTTGVEAEASPLAKNRYVTLSVAGAAGRQISIRAVLRDLPPPFESHEGEIRWVTTPQNISELSLQNDATPPVFKAAGLVCNQVIFDANVGGLLHIYGKEIVPKGVYEFEVFDAACGVAFDESDALPVTVATTTKWTDMCASPGCGPPDGNLSVVDVVGLLNKFGNYAGAPIKARSDLAPDLPDQRINVSDITFGLNAFGGQAYPFSGPSTCP